MSIQRRQDGKSALPFHHRKLRGAVAQRGVVLFVGLVFLIVLTLIALVVMRGTLLEMHMTSASARHEQAFEASEAARVIPEALLVEHVFNRGWPKSWGGTIPDAMFSLSTTYANRTAWLTLLKPDGNGQGLQDMPTSCGSGLVYFYLPMPTCGASAADSYLYTPSKWTPSVKFNTCLDGSSDCGTAGQVQNTVAIVRDGVAINQGSGAAMSQGYASIGVGSAKGGGALLLQVKSQSQVPGNGEATTIAQYKLNIDH
jgi:hypothetical protein